MVEFETGYCRLPLKWIWPCSFSYDLMHRFSWMPIWLWFELGNVVLCFANASQAPTCLYFHCLHIPVSFCFPLHCLGLMWLVEPIEVLMQVWNRGMNWGGLCSFIHWWWIILLICEAVINVDECLDACTCCYFGDFCGQVGWWWIRKLSNGHTTGAEVLLQDLIQ